MFLSWKLYFGLLVHLESMVKDSLRTMILVIVSVILPETFYYAVSAGRCQDFEIPREGH